VEATNCLNGSLSSTRRIRILSTEFSNESLLYVADTGGSHTPNGPRHIRRFTVGAGARLSGGEVFATCSAGLFDGFRLDTHGNVWSSTGEGVHCFAPDGTLVGKIKVPEIVSNVCFGGAKRNRLFVAASHSVYSLYVNTQGARLW